MPDTLRTPEQFKAAVEAFAEELEPILRRYEAALNGPAGLIVAIVTILGNLSVNTLTLAPEALTSIVDRFNELQLYVATAGSRPQ